MPGSGFVITSRTKQLQQNAAQIQRMQLFELSLEQNRLIRAAGYLKGAEIARARGETAKAIFNYRRTIATAPGSPHSLVAMQALVDFQTDAKSMLREVDDLMASNKRREAAAFLTRFAKQYGNLPASDEIQQIRSRLHKSLRLAN